MTLTNDSIINGRYQLHEKLGEGGMGTVHRATDRLTGNLVALKQITISVNQLHQTKISNTQATKDTRLALAHEFQTLASLHHPYIIDVLDFGFDNSTTENPKPFFTMTYLPDVQTIKEAGAGKSVAENMLLIQQTLQAIAYLHRRNILHRDLKPENVLVSQNRLQVVDFGLAASRDQNQSDSSGGTLYYLAPEVWDNETYTIAADLYSIGVMAYELLTDKHPFAPFDHTFIDRVQDAEPDFSLMSDNKALATFIGQLLSKKPKDRFPNAETAIAALSDALGQPTPVETEAIRESYLQAATFVGREAEMQQLQQAMQATEAGQGGIWLVGGESGVGKSRLLAEFRTQLLVSGWQVLTGQAVAEGGAPYQLWRGVIPQLALLAPMTDREAGILKEIAPQLETILDRSLPDPPSLPGTAAHQRTVQTIVSLLQQLQRPTLLLLEDLQWTIESLDPIKALASNQIDSPLLVVATFRNDESPDLPQKLPGASLLTLPRLDQSAIQTLSQSMLGKEIGNRQSVLSFLQQETEGNAFFLVEVVRSLVEAAGQFANVGQDDLPTGVITGGMQRILEWRLSKIDKTFQPLLKTMAVAGRYIDLNVLAHLSGEIDLDEWLINCNEAAILFLQDNQWYFTHEKLREAILSELAPQELANLHEQVALAIEAAYEDYTEHIINLAKHWQMTDHLEKAVIYSCQAGEQLFKSGSFQPTVNILLPLTQRPIGQLDIQLQLPLFLLLGRVYRDLANYPESIKVCRQALALARQQSDPKLLMESLIGLGWSLWRQGDQPNFDEAESCFQEAIPLADSLNDLVGKAHAIHNQGIVFAIRDHDSKKSTEYFIQALGLFQEANNLEGIALSNADLGINYFETNEFEKVKIHAQKAWQIVDEVSWYAAIPYIAEVLLPVTIIQGEWHKIEEYVQKSLKWIQEDWRYYHIQYYDVLAQLHRQEYEQANERIIELLSILEKDENTIAATGHPLPPKMHQFQLSFIALMQNDDTFTDSLQTLTHDVNEFESIECLYLILLSAAQLMQANDVARGAEWIALVTTELQKEITRAEEQHLADVIAQIKVKFAEHLETPEVQPILQRDIRLSIDEVLSRINPAYQPVKEEKVHANGVMMVNGRYLLHEKLGEGGMGVVYRATDRLTGEILALKQITSSPANLHLTSPPRTMSSKDLRLALADEFQTLATLRHPHIITVLDYGFAGEADQKQPYFTMAYLENSQTILDASKALNTSEKVHLIQQLLEAIAYLHRRGILHRDLKPENVLVTEQMVKVLDFGLSSPTGKIQSSGGSYAYAAPEVWEKEAITEATDLYAVGVLAYQIFAGEHPFNIESHRFIDYVLDTAPDLTQLNVDEALANVVGKLLAKKPESRFTSADACLAAFGQAIGEKEITENVDIRESYLQAATFVGRETELEQLTTALAQAHSGRGSAWLVGGESGVGKSRLLNEFRIRALVDGALLLRGQGVDGSGGLPYQLWRNVIRRLALNTDLDDLSASVLATIVPDLGQLLNRHIPAPPVIAGQASQQRLYSTIVNLFRQQTQLMVLLLEDLQWTSESLTVLQQLNRVVADLPLLIIGSYRDNEYPTLPNLLPEMHLLKLDRLSNAEIEALSISILGEHGQQGEILDLLQRESEGNTFFLVEVVRALAEEAGQLRQISDMALPDQLLPEGIQTIVKRRLEQVPIHMQNLLRLAAIIGRTLDMPVLKNFASESDLEHWLTICINTAVIEASEGDWRFTHDKIRQGVLAELSSAEKTALHQQVAEAIEKSFPDEADQAANLVFHYHEAGNQKKEAYFARIAGKHALSQFANAVATKFLTLALDLTPETDTAVHYQLLLNRERAYATQGLREAQAQDLASLEKLAATIVGNDAKVTQNRQAEIAFRQAEYYDLISDFPAAIAASQRTIAFAQAAQNERYEAQGYTQWGTILVQQSDYEQAAQKLEQALALAQKANLRQAEAHALYKLAILYLYNTDNVKARAHCRQSMEIYQEINDRFGEALAHNYIGLSYYSQQDFELAEAELKKCLTISQEIGATEFICRATHNLGCVSFSLGNYEKAQQLISQAIAISRELSYRRAICLSSAFSGFAAHLAGDNDLALERNQQALKIVKEIGDPHSEALINLFLGHVLKELNQLTAARDAYQRALDYWQTLQQRTNKHIEAMAGLARVSLAQKDKQQAQRYVEMILSHLETNSLDGTDQPLRIYLTCFQTLNETEDPRAATLLKQAYSELQERAAKISNEEIRQSFLENVAAHREIQEEFNRLFKISAKPESSKAYYKQETDLTAHEAEILEAYIDAEEDESEATSIDTQDVDPSILLEYLLSVSQRMATMHDLDLLLTYALDEVLQLVKAESGYIVLINDDGTLEFKTRRSHDGTELPTEADMISYSVLDEVVTTGKSIVIRNAMIDPRFGQAASVMYFRLRSIMCAPLITQNRTIGAIYVENHSKSGRFSQSSLQPLEFFSNQAAIYIENANLYNNLENLVAERTEALEQTLQGLKETQIELVAAKDAAESASQIKSSFLAGMSHELRTPLNAIINFTGFVLDGVFGPINTEQADALEKTLDSSEHLLNLINDVLDLSKIETGKMDLFIQDVNINSMILSVAATANGLMKNKAVELILNIEENLPHIQGDKRRLRQVMLNLVSNAIKFTVAGNITISAYLEDNTIHIRVKDTGIGIALQDQELIFESFQQAEHDLYDVSGTGLGLPISKHFVEAHGGEIWLESEVGVGSTFYVSLPVQHKDV